MERVCAKRRARRSPDARESERRANARAIYTSEVQMNTRWLGLRGGAPAARAAPRRTARRRRRKPRMKRDAI